MLRNLRYYSDGRNDVKPLTADIFSSVHTISQYIVNQITSVSNIKCTIDLIDILVLKIIFIVHSLISFFPIFIRSLLNPNQAKSRRLKKVQKVRPEEKLWKSNRLFGQKTREEKAFRRPKMLKMNSENILVKLQRKRLVLLTGRKEWGYPKNNLCQNLLRKPHIQ